MLSWRAREDGKQLAAVGQWSGDGGCFCHSVVKDGCAATLSQGGQATNTAETAPEQGAEAAAPSPPAPVVEGSSYSGSLCSSSSNSSSSSSSCCCGSTGSISSNLEVSRRPMVVVQVQRAADTVSYLAVGRSRRSSLPQPRSYNLHTFSSSSSSSSFFSSSPVTSSSSPSSSLSSPLPCLQNAVPMVALECELSASGRLSPPVEFSRTMSAPFLTAVAEGGGVVNSFQQHLSNGVADPVHEVGDGASPTGSSELVSASLVSPASPYPVARSGSKRKLPRREDAICEEDEDVEMAHCQAGDHACRASDTGIPRGCCGDEEWEDASERKRRRLDDGEEEKDRLSCEDQGVEDRVGDVADRSRNYNMSGHQKVNCVVYDCLSTVSVSTNPPSTESEIALDVVVDDSLESVVEVDVVGDEDEGGPQPSAPAQPSADSTVDTEHCSSEEASSEDGEDDAFLMTSRPPRISPFLNTPKQRKEERRKILKMSIHKMRSVEDPEHFLRRSVLINNTMKRLQRELREEKMRNNPRRSCYGLYRRASSLHYDVLNNSYLLHDEPFAVSENDRITDDMTDALVTKLEATSSPVAPTPSPSPCPTEDPDTSSVMFSTVTSEPPAWSSEVSSTVPELSTQLTSVDNLPQPSLSSQEELMPSISQPTSETVSTTSGEDLTSSSSPSLSSLSSPSSSSSCMLYDGMFNVPNLGRDPQSPSSSCSSQSQREKQLYADMDTVFNNLIHALGDS